MCAEFHQWYLYLCVCVCMYGRRLLPFPHNGADCVSDNCFLLDYLQFIRLMWIQQNIGMCVQARVSLVLRSFLYHYLTGEHKSFKMIKWFGKLYQQNIHSGICSNLIHRHWWWKSIDIHKSVALTSNIIIFWNSTLHASINCIKVHLRVFA